MSATENSTDETEVDNQIENIRRRCDSALQRRLNNPDCLSPATLIRILSPVIEKYLDAGLVLEEVAKALQEEGFKITKGHLVRHLGSIRAESGLPQIKRGRRAQVAAPVPGKPGNDGGQRDTITQAKAQPPSPVVAADPPRQGISVARELSEKEKIDLIVETIPSLDREWPELADMRLWKDESGKTWDVAKAVPNAPTDIAFTRQSVFYTNARRKLMEEWGLGVFLSDASFKLRYTLSEKPKLTVDLDQLLEQIR